MKKHFLFAALFLATLSIGFIACDNDDEPHLNNDDDNIENVVDGDSITIADSLISIESYDVRSESVTFKLTLFDPSFYDFFDDISYRNIGMQLSKSKESGFRGIMLQSNTPYERTGSGLDYFLTYSSLKSNTTYYYRWVIKKNDDTYLYGPICEVNTNCLLIKKEYYDYDGYYDKNGNEITFRSWIEHYPATTALYDDYREIKGYEFAKGEEVTLTAHARDYWYLDSWSNTNEKNSVYTIKITSDTTITAYFKMKPYLKLNTEGRNGARPKSSYLGTTSGSGYCDIATEVTITATPKDNRLKFVEWNDGNTENPRTITINSDTIFTAIFEPESPHTITGAENGYRWVDLGLPSGLKWATCNVGANNGVFYSDGFFYAWGDPDKISDRKYKWSDNMGEMTKYNKDDQKKILDPEDDMVTANWGGNWRLPTKDEMTELIDNCAISYVDDDNAYSSNPGFVYRSLIFDTEIFLPMCGYYGGSSEVGKCAFYRTSQVSSYADYSYSWTLNLSYIFNYSNIISDNHKRKVGFSCRGVCEIKN